MLRLSSLASFAMVLAAVLTGLPSSALAQGKGDRRFAVALYHFNLQYCAGGLEEFRDDHDLTEIWKGLDASAEGVEDAIIEESFHPLLELFAAHPGWGADFELQGLMVDVIRERHPETLALMQDLDLQVSWDSFHYSDELWTAQPPDLMRRSRAATMKAFSDANLNCSDVVFSQEGQFGMGMGEALSPGAVAVLPRNLFGLHYPDEDRKPLFSINDLWVLIGGHSFTVETEGGTIEFLWTFLDDGELLATQDINPYLLPSFVHDPEAVAAYEEQLLSLEADGYEIVSIRTAVDALLASGYSPEPLPPVGDGTWQPDNTSNLGLWMGDAGGFAEGESDGGVRRRFHQAYGDVQLAQQLVDLGLAEDPRGLLEEGWRQVMLAGVSDATGWNPYRSEVAYSLEASEEALVIAQEVFATLPAPSDGNATQYQLEGEQLLSLNPDALPERFTEASGPVSAEVETEEDSGVVASLQWFSDPRFPQASGLQARFEGLVAGDPVRRSLKLYWSEDELHFLPAGREQGMESIPLTLFAEQDPAPTFPLANGILRVGPSLYAVLDPLTMLLSVRVHPEFGYALLQDETPSLDEREIWELYFVTNEASALAMADSLIWNPRRLLPGGTGAADAGACGGCAMLRPSPGEVLTSRFDAGSWLVLLVLFLGRRLRWSRAGFGNSCQSVARSVNRG